MKLALNGINLGSMLSASTDQKSKLRDVGDVAVSVAGDSRVSRTKRKIDEQLESIFLSPAQAKAWRSLIGGEGEVWAFDTTSFYGSKGTPTTGIINASIGATSPAARFGSLRLSLGATTGTVTFPALYSYGEASGFWTVGLWRYESSAWHHYVVRSDAAVWRDGVRNDLLPVDWLVVSPPEVTLENGTGSAVFYDDIVILPFEVLDDWPAQWFASIYAFGSLPYLVATGDFVDEATHRIVFATDVETTRKRAASSMISKLTWGLTGR